jgi:hypothetical protein
LSDTANRIKVGGIRHGLSIPAHRLSRALPSLFVVSLPRSFSSYTYLLARSALLMGEPRFTTFGEVLNPDRFDKGYTPREEVRNFFVRQNRDPAAFHRNIAFLDRVVEAHGFAYKDVCQPFVMAAWLRSRKEFRILHIRRNIADVAAAMLRLGWVSSAAAANHHADIESAVIEGLLWADKVLATLPAITVEYDDLVRDGTALSAALLALYPDFEVHAIRFRNDELAARHARTMALRASPQYAMIERVLRDLGTNLGSTSPE